MRVLQCKIHGTVADNSPDPNTHGEKTRQKILRALDLLRPEPDPALDNLTRLAAEIARVPMAAISLTNSEAQFYKARHNWKPGTLPHGQSPCAVVTDLDETIVIEDLKKDERFSGMAQMEVGDELRFYAGFPLRVDEISVGTLCVAHTQPHSLAEAQLSALSLLAEQAMLHLKICETIHSLESEKRELEIQELGAELAEEKYRSIFEHVQEGIFQTTAEGRFISANPMLAKIYGYDSPEELIAHLDDISGNLYVDPRRRDEFVKLMQQSGKIQNFVSRVCRLDGELIWISENVRVVRNNDRELLYYEGTVIDITEQKETEQALRDSELLYHSLVESIPQNIVRKDLEGHFTFANQKFCQTIGKPLEEILGKTDHDLSPKDLADKYLRDDLQVIKTGRAFETMEEHTTPEGGKIVIDVIKIPLLDSDGKIIGTQCMFWDVTERHQMEEQLAYERDLLNAILENVPDRIFIKDTESRFIKGSAALARRLGLESVDEMIGKNDYDFHPADQAKDFHEDEQRVILTGKPLVNKVEKQTDSSGRPIWASVTKVPFTNRTGIVTGIIGISRDITALKLAEQESGRARDLALEAAQMKAQFLAVMSHEIRTPMNGIIGMIDLLLDSDLSDEQREYAGTVRTSADALLEILNDILDLTKIEAGRLELEKEKFSIRQVVEEAVELHALRAESNDIELNCHIPAELDGHFRGDAGRLRQILLNLVSNAVKFTDAGEVQASVSQVGETAEGVEIQFTVRDTGIGITPEVREKIFDAFRQADGSTNRRYGGTGLGLSISRQLTEMMGGELWLESELGTGSTFYFTALLERADTIPPPPPTELNGQQLLLIVPNDFARIAIGEYAAQWKMEIASVASGKDARKWLKKNNAPKLILLDLSLRDVDCLDLVREIQSHEQHQSAKIILLTTRRHKVDPGMLRTLGVAGTVLKPVRWERLHMALLSALTGKSTTPKITIGTDASHFRSLRVLVAEDNPINQRVATLQLTKLGHQVELRDDGQGVLDAELDEFDVVLMDCQMPNIDGYEATRQIRQREQSDADREPMYIIAMTANTQADDRAACLEAGMDNFISKPVQLGELENALNKSLGMDADSASSGAAPLLDESQLDQLRGDGEDNEFLEIIDLFLTQTEEQIGQLNEAVGNQDSATTSYLAHQLKGSSANLGARRLADALSRLEQSAINSDLAHADPLLKEIQGTFDRTRVQFQAVLDE